MQQHRLQHPRRFSKHRTQTTSALQHRFMGKKEKLKGTKRKAVDVVALPDCSTDGVTCDKDDEEEIEMTSFEHVMEVIYAVLIIAATAILLIALALAAVRKERHLGPAGALEQS